MGAKPTWRGAKDILALGCFGCGEIGGVDGGFEM